MNSDSNLQSQNHKALVFIYVREYLVRSESSETAPVTKNPDFNFCHHLLQSSHLVQGYTARNDDPQQERLLCSFGTGTVSGLFDRTS